MPMTMFHTLFPDLGARETRTVTVTNDRNLPDGEYGLVELYCDEVGCDCRRVIFYIVSAPPDMRIWATINFGWETQEFYERWAKSPAVAEGAQGASLEPFGPQSSYSWAFLAMVERVLSDEQYVVRLQRHYALFKEAIATLPAAAKSPAKPRKRSTRRRKK